MSLQPEAGNENWFRVELISDKQLSAENVFLSKIVVENGYVKAFGVFDSKGK